MGKLTPEVKGPVSAHQQPELFRAILEALTAAQATGDMPPRHMEPPQDVSGIFWIGSRENLIGYAVVHEAYPKVAWIDVFWIAPLHRGKGLGSALMLAVTGHCQRRGFKSIELGTAPANNAMLALCGLAGFTPKAIVMERSL